MEEELESKSDAGQTRDLLFDIEELWHYERIWKERTKLKYDIFVDDNAAYKLYNHPLWLIVERDNFLIPITIESEPKIMAYVKNGDYDYSDVIDYIKRKHIILEQYANEEIDISSFYHMLVDVD